MILHYLLLRIAIAGVACDGSLFRILTQAPLYVFQVASLLPGVAVAVRRLHDTGRSGWWLLLSFLPIVGPLYLLFLYCIDGDMGANRYGPSPK